MARTFFITLNIDEINALAMRLISDSERAFAWQGLLLGVNAGELPDDMPRQFQEGWQVGRASRDLTEERRAKQGDGGRKSAHVRMDKFGTAQPPRSNFEDSSKEPRSGSEVALEVPGLRITDDLYQEGTSISVQEVPRLEPTPPQKAPSPKKRVTPTPKPRLEDILGPKGSFDDRTYWEIVGIFGSQKNPAPTQTAQAFIDAIQAVPVQTILAKARELRASMDDAKYMPMLQKWLEGEGYRNPTPSRQPARPTSVSADEATREQIRAMPLRMLNEVAG